MYLTRFSSRPQTSPASPPTDPSSTTFPPSTTTIRSHPHHLHLMHHNYYRLLLPWHLLVLLLCTHKTHRSSDSPHFNALVHSSNSKISPSLTNALAICNRCTFPPPPKPVLHPAQHLSYTSPISPQTHVDSPTRPHHARPPRCLHAHTLYSRQCSRR